MDELIALAQPFVLGEVKKLIPDADEKVAGHVLVVLGAILTKLGEGLAGSA